MSDPQKVIVVGFTGSLPTYIAEKLYAHDIALVEDYRPGQKTQGVEDYKPGPSLETFELMTRKVPACEPLRIPKVRLGKGEKRRKKKLRGW